MFGLESGPSVQRRYNLSKTTLQQSRLWGMVQKLIIKCVKFVEAEGSFKNQKKILQSCPKNIA